MSKIIGARALRDWGQSAALHSIFLMVAIAGRELYANAPPLLQIGGGIFEVFHDKHKQFQAQVEYKWAPFADVLRPFMGVMTTSRDSWYAYGGLGWEICLGKRLALTPSIAPGLYFQGGGKRLGYPLEIRSSLEVATIFANEYRLGAQFYHLSNASLGRKNPGAESLVFFLALPLAHRQKQAKQVRG